MALRPLDGILSHIEDKGKWQAQREFKTLLDCWPQVVGSVVAQQTQPISIQQNVLLVATSSPLWAQNLMFERLRILEKLNAQMSRYQSSPLCDIRFSTARWHRLANIANDSDAGWQEHPSFLNQSDVAKAGSTPETTRMVNEVPPDHPDNPQDAFQHWRKRVDLRSHALPLCPACQCPTPSGELRRWSVCGLCAVKKR